ncbi:hypothetical protein [Calidifontibacillus erzurumensis]|uniref:Uncharacterized protein n=1 Tax=Calidifontibacillus erzurumensis TaxID=2741433 RepID=A0A8J8GE40_9BACI|nr:hypothetical protein [Calidifontibacillus erzurumensis]NSL52170.1 hypothetical protein [Calidifontibacillus erzurumensis]
MENHMKVLRLLKYISGSLVLIGMLFLLIPIFESDSNDVLLNGIGIGFICASIFIFLIGIFFITTEEMLAKREEGVKIAPKLRRNCKHHLIRITQRK